MSEAIAAKLDEARALIEKGWCQGDYAKSAKGREVLINSPRATCFCVSGAVRRIVPEEPLQDQVRAAIAQAIGVRGQFALAIWNDNPTRTQAEVIEAFRKAAELARGDLVDPLERVQP